MTKERDFHDSENVKIEFTENSKPFKNGNKKGSLLMSYVRKVWGWLYGCFLRISLSLEKLQCALGGVKLKENCQLE